MADPLDDPRAAALMATDTEFLSWLIARYDDATRRASFTARGLRAAAAETTWEGTAADQFKDAIGVMPRQLDAVLNSYYGVRMALTSYLTEIETLQTQWQRAAAALDATLTPYTTARTQLGAATTAYRNACADEHLTSAQLTAVWNAVSRAKTAFDDESSTWTGAESSANAILAEFDAARNTLCGLIEKASCHAITPESFVSATRVTGGGGRVAPVSVTVGTGHGHGAGRDGGAPVGGGSARVPLSVRERLDKMDAYVKSVMGTRYVWGGGHSSFDPNGGLDCSGFVSGVLHSGGYLNAPQTTSTLPTQPGIDDGPGRYVTIYDRSVGPIGDQHVIIDLNGQFYEEGGIASGGAPDVHRFTPSPEYLQSFNRVLHPAGM